MESNAPHLLVDEGDEGEKSIENFKRCGKPSEWKATFKSDIEELLDMTFVFKAIRGETNASIKPLDEALRIDEFSEPTYIEVFINFFGNHSPGKGPKDEYSGRGSPCHKCNQYRGWARYNGNCRGCYKSINDGDLSYYCINCKLVRVRVSGYRCSGCATRKKSGERPKCVQCNRNQAVRKGLLCKKCFKSEGCKTEETYKGKGTPCPNCNQFSGLKMYNGNCRGCYLALQDGDLSYFCVDCKSARIRLRGTRCLGCATTGKKKS
jgi:hypothetical protein